MTKICYQNEIDKSDFMRNAIKESIPKHLSDSNDDMNGLRNA